MDQYVWRHDQEDAIVAADRVRPVKAWDEKIFVALSTQYGHTVVLTIEREGRLEEFWAGKAGMNSMLCFLATSGHLMLVRGDHATLLDRMGDHKDQDLPVDASLATELGEKIALGDKRSDVLYVYPGGSRQSKSVIRAAIRRMLGVGNTVILATEAPLTGRPRVETATFKDNKVKWRRLRVRESMWHFIRVGNKGVLWEEEEGTIIVTDGTKFRRIDWTAPAHNYDVCWSDRDEEIVAAYKDGYSVLTIPDDMW